MEHLSAGILKQLPAADLETADRLLKRELSEDFHKIVVQYMTYRFIRTGAWSLSRPVFVRIIRFFIFLPTPEV